MLTFTLYEDALGYTRAALTGLGGLWTGGPLSSVYDTAKKRAANYANLKTMTPQEMYNADTTGTDILAGFGSTIPLVGSLANMYQYKKRLDAEKRAKVTPESI